MRLVLEKNKQRELIDREKRNFNLSFPKLAEKLKIKSGRLHSYYYDNVLLPEEIFNRFSIKDQFSKFLIEKRNENWGKSKGGKNSKGSTKEINEPLDSKELAEFYGIMLGDGNLTMFYQTGTYQVRIVGDSRHDREYLTNYVKPLVESLFHLNVKISKVPNRNVLILTISGKKLANFLISKGFKPGDKIKNNLEIPEWIKNNKDYLKLCLRGLYDTDGSVYKLTNQNSHQICFTNYNNKLLKNVRTSLLDFGIKVSNITKGRDIVITKKEELRKFLNEVGFQNSRHLNKVKMWNLAS